MIEVSVIYKSNSVRNISMKHSIFPAGEFNICVEDELLSAGKINYMGGIDSIRIKWNFDSDAEFIRVAFITDAIRNKLGNVDLELFVPYFPYARQDRVCNEGEAFSLRVAADFIKNIGFKSITVVDPHSSVLQGMFPAGVLRVITQKEIVNQLLPYNLGKNITLVAPDEGSYKKIDAIYKEINNEFPDHNWSVIHCYKQRNLKTGEIIGFDTIEPIDSYLDVNDFVVFDDICDGGRTFIELAKQFEVVRNKGSKLHLCVTHGIFSKGVDVLYEAGYDSVSCFNDMSN